MKYTFQQGRSNVHKLEAPYALLAAATRNDGNNDRDDYKSMAQWDLTAPDGSWAEVYDYKIGKCYHPDGLEREKITSWNVQGEPEGITYLLALLDEHVNKDQ